MSYYVYTRLVLSGDAEQIDLFKKENAPPKLEEDEHDDLPRSFLTFSGMHDCPYPLYSREEKEGEAPDWQKWKLINWGTQGDCLSLEEWENLENNIHSIKFVTWESHPNSWLSQVARYYEKLTIKMYSSSAINGWVALRVYNEGFGSFDDWIDIKHEEEDPKTFWEIVKQSEGVGSRTDLKKTLKELCECNGEVDDEAEKLYADWCERAKVTDTSLNCEEVKALCNLDFDEMCEQLREQPK